MEKKMENEMETGGIWKGSSLDFGSARVSSRVPTGMSPDTSDQTVGSAGSDRF